MSEAYPAIDVPLKLERSNFGMETQSVHMVCILCPGTYSFSTCDVVTQEIRFDFDFARLAFS